MLESLIVVGAELGLACLFFVLGYRMTDLARGESFALAGMGVTVSDGAAMESCVYQRQGDESHRAALSPATDRTELITQLHILFGLQDRVCRNSHLVLVESPLSIKQYAAAWMYGAAGALVAPAERHSERVMGVVSQLMGRKLEFDAEDAREAMVHLTRCPIYLACYRSGLEGAEHWQAHHFIPGESALNTAITNNAFI
ncbi:hypothetical protein [Marinobacter zhejiangensis]|uniref:Uncharacterized protein n=1 Tax=Marinobacter zhejiangensis TaxID=488535 RepID=A0A1I4RYN9_9GAMM|nr:hypothetical protein [Marinobacter zhejiangensis]SFM57291.1 hypothetical protein SAMN04487963_3028 [Marinobacter zhejiangensis]